MSRRFAAPARRLLLLALVVLVAVPATGAEAVCYQKAVDAQGNPAGPSFCTQTVWLHQAQTKAGNLGATGQTPFPTWDTTKPASSVTSGAGGGYATVGAGRQLASDPARDAATGATFKGKYTGDIDNLVVELYLFAPATAAADPAGAYVGSVDLTVDGQQIMTPTQVNLVLEPAGDAVLKTKFALTDIQAAMEAAGVPTGAGAVHDITFFFGAYGLVSASSVVVYDTTEVPSNMTFNVPTLPEALPAFSTGA